MAAAELAAVYRRLQRSAFRRRFRLGRREIAYLRLHGREVIAGHAGEFVRRRLAPARPPNDGRQTPWRGHPVFIAQHATATCCRRCLEKWHGIPRLRPLTAAESDFIVTLIMFWLENAAGKNPPRDDFRPPLLDL